MEINILSAKAIFVLVEGGFGGGELAFERVTLLIDYFDNFYGFEGLIANFGYQCLW